MRELVGREHVLVFCQTVYPFIASFQAYLQLSLVVHLKCFSCTRLAKEQIAVAVQFSKDGPISFRQNPYREATVHQTAELWRVGQQ